jgi:prepilin-type N-terminal cleavage/methylation domain-containing protein
MRKRGFTLVELMSGMTIMSMVILGSLTLLITGIKSYKRTSADVDITNQNANTVRRLSETLRQAINVSITNSGKTISFNLPKIGAVDPTTGEAELLNPVVSDGVARSYSVDFGSGKLTEQPSGRVLVKAISPTDPQVGSSQYNQAYTPFQLTTIGSYRAITINLITKQDIVADKRYSRMKTTTVVRNLQ